ncbi:hypothetical protein [Pseudarthrobacter siccitolerans]
MVSTKTAPADIRAEAYNRITGYRDTEAALAHATQWEKDLYAERAAFTSITIDTAAAFRDAAYNQGAVPREAAKAEREAAQERADFNTTLERVTGLKNELKTTLESILANHADDALEHLNTELSELVEEVRGNAEGLHGLEDVEAIVREGGAKLKAYQQLSAYLKRYDDIRAAQADITTRALRNNGVSDSGTRWLYTVGLLADALDKEEHWLLLRNGAYRGIFAGGAGQQYEEWLSLKTTGKAAWPSALERRSWHPTPRREAHLLWACTDATPWVPSLAQLQEAYDAATASAQPAQTLTTVEYATAARAKYRKVTGTTD